VEKEIKFLDSENFEFSAYDVISENQLRINHKNDYAVFLFPTIKLSQITIKDLRSLQTKKWERLKLSTISLNEKTILWRLWHNSLISFHIANIMGLISDSNCPYCITVKPNCRHVLFCASSNVFWDFIRSPIKRKNGNNETIIDRLYGYAEHSYLNDVIYIASCILYRRFLYNINSGDLNFDLIEKFKLRFHEYLSFEYYSAKYNNCLDKFMKYWYNGLGIFQIVNEDDTIEMTCW